VSDVVGMGCIEAAGLDEPHTNHITHPGNPGYGKQSTNGIKTIQDGSNIEV